MLVQMCMNAINVFGHFTLCLKSPKHEINLIFIVNNKLLILLS